MHFNSKACYFLVCGVAFHNTIQGPVLFDYGTVAAVLVAVVVEVPVGGTATNHLPVLSCILSSRQDRAILKLYAMSRAGSVAVQVVWRSVMRRVLSSSRYEMTGG